MTLFRRFLKDRRRGVIGWSLSMSAFLGLQNAFYPSFKEQMSELEIPEGASDFLGFGGVPLTEPAGWLQAQIFAILPILLAIYAVSLGVRAIATSEEDGTLELILSNPVERVRVAWERYLGFVLLVALVGTITCAFILATSPLFGLTENVSLPGYAAATLGAIQLGLLFGSVSFGIGAATGRRALALSLAAGVAVGTYVINGLAATVEAAGPLRFLSPFRWYLSRNMLAEGIAWEALTLPLAFSSLFVVWGVWGFTRRDLH